MATFDRLIVGLDFTEMDETLLQYTNMLVQQTQPGRVYFFYVTDEPVLPDVLIPQYKDTEEPVDEIIHDEMLRRIEAHIKEPGETEIHTEVHIGQVTKALLEWSDTKHVDLIVLGNKKGKHLRHANFRHIINRSHCSVLIVPQGAPAEIGRIFVPVDFSPISEHSLSKAHALAHDSNARVSMQNVYTVPMGYHSGGKTYEEFAEIMLGHAEEDSHQFVKKLGLDEDSIDYVYTLDDDSDPVDKIYLEAHASGSDLVVMGSKGRSFGASLLLGSVSGRMAEYDKIIPLLIVKDKEENLSFIDALLRL